MVNAKFAQAIRDNGFVLCLTNTEKFVKDNTQESRSFVGPLMDQESKDLQDNFEKICEPLPERVQLKDAKSPK